MIKISGTSRVYIACPAAFATGGPELLHQLAFNLRKHLHVDAAMFYFPSDHPNPVHPAYKKYNNPFVRRIDDEPGNILVVPEVAGGIALLKNYGRIRKAVWWLSVDDFYYSDPKNIMLSFYKAVNKVLFLATKNNLIDAPYIAQLCARADMLKHGLIRRPLMKQVDFHFAQSFYAKKHLIEVGIEPQKVLYLSDYLNEDFLRIKVNPSQKQDIAAYNPKKGYSFTKKIIEAAPDIKFVPLSNMARKQVIDTLKTAKVYIDFGNHPGKDRMPREAAMLLCHIITGRRGSAGFYKDVPLPDRYKFDIADGNIPEIVRRIRECFNKPVKQDKALAKYRKIIESEPGAFLKDLKNIFRMEKSKKRPS